MKLATGILLLGMLGTAGAQNPSIIDTTKAKLNAVQQQRTADSNAALSQRLDLGRRAIVLVDDTSNFDIGRQRRH